MKAKRLTTLLLALVMALSLAVPAAAAPITFTDVKPSDWFYSDVQKAVDTGLIDGYPDNTYGPAKNMTYAEAIKLAAVMYRMATTGSNEFETGNPWYQPYVDYAKDVGVISKDYDWNSPATRAGYMEIFAKAIPDMPALAGMEGLKVINTVPDGSIPDVPMTHPQAAAIYKLYRAGILQGNDAQHTCRPESNIQRSEVAAILTRMMNPSERLSFSMGEETAPLTVTTQPADATTTVGGDATFTVAVTGGRTPYKYEWHRLVGTDSDWIPEDPDYFDGIGTASLTTKNCEARENNDKYYCIVTDADGKTVESDKATLTVTDTSSLTITQDLQSDSINEGSSINFVVKVSGGKAPYTFEWYQCYPDRTEFTKIKDMAEYYAYYGISDQGDASVLSVEKAGTHSFDQDGIQYRCVIFDADNNEVTTKDATLTVNLPPLKVDKMSRNQGANTGSNVTLFVEVTGGKAPYTYQWYYCNPGDTTYWRVEEAAEWTSIFKVGGSGARSELTLLQYNKYKDLNGAKFRCEITDANNNTVTSDPISVTVAGPRS